MEKLAHILGREMVKEAGIGGLIGKGIGWAGAHMAPALPWLRNMGSNAMAGARSGALGAAHVIPSNINPSSLLGMGHGFTDLVNRGVGGTFGGVLGAMTHSNIPGLNTMSRAIAPAAMGMARNAAPLMGGAAVMNHINGAAQGKLMDQNSAMNDYINQYHQAVNEYMQNQQNQSGWSDMSNGAGKLWHGLVG